MELQVNICDITPQNPVFQGGYYTRDRVYDSIHDSIMASIFVLTINSEKYVWIGVDLSNGTTILIDKVLEYLKEKNIHLEKDHLVLGGSHTHSGPNIYVDKEPDRADYDYLCYAANKIAEGIKEAYQTEPVEVTTKYSKIYIDGLYSNRNDKQKLCDKYIHLIGFFHQDQLQAIHVTLSHHCTILGPDNFQLSADLFGALRKKLEIEYGIPILMAQGNAGDMGNRQYRLGNGFEALEYQSDAIFQQIKEKIQWESVKFDTYDYKVYYLDEHYILDASFYEDKVKEYENKLKSAKTIDERKILNSVIKNYHRKADLGSGEKQITMKVEIIQMGELQLIVVPGELSSYLGMEIKKRSSSEYCIIWGYANDANLSYIIDNDGYDSDSFESRISIYPKGVGEDYKNFIIEHL
ncbi:hypothetical protein [Breznakia pachnodae]|uniref:Neutral/alkaline non-lysosomal ceramidase N-terminal domain-containing protein n=1 Tax=Breznakia pachnodae TaxID=265178 RepID=A0ABU0E168_9FIRM|nr:hypothetical protein [Breznakia pachnodae]MDQ0360529.1 hypothetical protein [Breznakia pachnodae]